MVGDLRDIAKTSSVIKCLERFLKSKMLASLPPNFNPNKFAYKFNRSHDDVLSIVNHEMRLHLESKDSYVRIIFIDFKDAFTTLSPSILRLKMLKKALILTYANGCYLS